MNSLKVTDPFTFDGAKLLFAHVERVSVDELRYLLARGSGHVVKGGQKQKTWFRAQCAHYGLCTQGTVAALRHRLDIFLAGPFPQIPDQIVLLEKEKREKFTASELKADLLDKIQEQNELSQGIPRAELSDRRGGPTLVPPMSLPKPLADKTNHGLVDAATCTSPPNKWALPRAKLTAVIRLKKMQSYRAQDTLQQIKLMIGRPLPIRGLESDTESDDDSSFTCTSTPNGYMGTNSRTSHRPPTRPFPLSLTPFANDTVSGQWNLRVTNHSMPLLPAPWRPASSKWLNGNMNIHFSTDGRSLVAEFSLLGMDGVFRSSRRCGAHEDGISAWVRFVAQIPLTTAKPNQQFHKVEHNLVLGPSELQYGYLRFYGRNKVGGFLRCRKYGRVEFAGFRAGGPVEMMSRWGNFVE